MHAKSEPIGTSNAKRPTLAEEMAAIGVDLDKVRYGSDEADDLDVERLLTGDSVPRRRGPRTHDNHLAVKWGIPDLLNQQPADKRTTRGSYSQAVQGHIGDGIDTREEVIAASPDKECAKDAALEDERPTTSVALSHGIPGAYIATWDDSGSDNEVSDSEDDEGWESPKKTAIPMAEKLAALQNAARYFPDWFGIKEEEVDEGLPSPNSQEVKGWVPNLLNFDPVDYSLFNQFLAHLNQQNFEVFESKTEESVSEPESDSEIEAEWLRRAMEDSKTTYQEEQTRRNKDTAGNGAGPSRMAHISCGAVITEVTEEAKPKDESVSQFAPPKDAEPKKKKKLTAKDKGKGVDRTQEQRDFLKKFASGASSKTKVKPKEDDKRKALPSKRKPASSFIREPSQMPDGGYLRKATKKRYESSDDEDSDSPPSKPPTPPSSSSSSSSSESSSSSSSESSEPSEPESSSSSSSDDKKAKKKARDKRKRKEYKKKRKERKDILTGVKIKQPFIWKGLPDLEVFDQWIYEVDNWQELNGLTDKYALRLVKGFMSGPAAKFFMKHVATDLKHWTMKLLYDALFNYCFPLDFKEELRENLENATQGTAKIRDFVRDLETLAERFEDVTDIQIVKIFWKGMHQYLRLYLIKKGYTPETTKLSKLVKHASRRERAQEVKEKEEREFRGKRPGRGWGRFKNRTNGPENVKQAEQTTAKHETTLKPANSAKKPENSPKGNQENSQNKKGKDSPRERKNPLSREERDRLRAEGRCFNCRDVGHESRNCPKRKTAKAPTVHAGSVRFDKLEQLAKQARQTLNVSAVRIDPDMIITDLESSEDEPEEHTTGKDDELRDLVRAMIMSTHQIEMEDLEERFQVIDLGNRFEIIDWEDRPSESCIIYKEQLGNEDFCMKKALTNREALEPRSSKAKGFPTMGEPFERHAATSWLHMRFAAALEGENPDERVMIEPVTEGYRVIIPEEDISFVVTHQEVTDDSFDAGELLKLTREDDFILKTEEDAEGYFIRRAIRERNNRERTRIMFGAIQPRKPKKAVNSKSADHFVSAIERNAMRTRDLTRKIPKTLVITVKINGKPVKALLDSGSMADFVSTTIVDQLKLEKEVLVKQLPVQLAVHGSRTKINSCTTVDFEYQGIKGPRRFDIANLDTYDVILGTPFFFQHKVAIGFNPSRVVVGCVEPEPIKGVETAIITSMAMDILEDELEKLRNQLRKEAEDLCTDAERTELPPMRAVNHRIPLIDEKRIYPYRPAKCPDALKKLWHEKKEKYLASGRWRIATGRNAIPILLIPKPRKDNEELKLRVTFDKRPQNENTVKLASPLPDIDGILRNVARFIYMTGMDGKNAYEQIRIEPEDVHKTLFTTPDGTMELLVLQQGDCNGPATYQTLMNHIFAPYIGVFMDVYLDDIIIYSNTIEEHMKHIRTVFDVLRWEKLYLGADKMQFFARKLKILGHIIDKEGIAMDPHKVDKIANWKVPTNKSLLSSFLGAVGFLAPDCKGIRIPMAVLTPLTGSTSLWRWTETHQRAFEEVQTIVQQHADHRRKPLDYSKEAPKINLVTDASMTGASGYISQGNDLKTAKVVTFWSGKFNSAQQNYPVHEQELLAIVESLKRFRPLLHGARFRICTDHKGLEFIKTQKHLSPRQHRWVDVLNEFDYDIQYIPGETNVLADALSRIYSDEPVGIERAKSEYVQDNDNNDDLPTLAEIEEDSPVYTGAAAVITTPRKSSRLGTKPRVEYDVLHGNRQRKPRNEVPKPKEPEIVPETERANQLEPNDNKAKGERKVKRNNKGKITVINPKESADPQIPNIVVTMGDLGIPMPDSIKGRYKEDPFFREIIENPKEHRHFVEMEGLVFYDREGTWLLCIPDIFLGKRRIREMIIAHGHSILAHLGTRKTLNYLKEEVWWKSLVDDVATYCKTCGLCAMSKSSTQKPMGLLKTLQVPRRPWQYIGIDFVGPLPASTNRLGSFDMICVVIDLLTSMVHLTPTVQTYGASQMAEVIFENVYKLHGLPERIISDRDTLFTSTFWRRLHELLRTELRLSSSYHPQTDGATERANRTMTQMLRQCVRPDQKDWVMKLPAIELAMNTARSDTTGFSPFYLNYGRMPRSLIWEGESTYPGVQEFAERMKQAIMAAHDAIIAARVQQTKQANKHRRDAPFKENDLVYLSTKNLKPPKGRARKLIPKFLGPFRILKVIEPGATYKLELPQELKARGINDAFHASLLRQHIPNDDRRFPGRLPHQIPGFGEHPKEWIVDRIISHSGKGSDAEFEVQWSTGDITWVPYHDIKHLQAFDEYCEALGITQIGQLQTGKAKERTYDVPIETLSMNRMTLVLPKRGDLNGRAYRSSIKELRWEGEPSTSKNSPIASLPTHSHIAQYSSTSPMANSFEFTAQDYVVCEKHAKLLTSWLSGIGPYPGNPPQGYTDVFVKKCPIAPNPNDFAEKIAKETAKLEEAKSDSEFDGVKMSTGAFTALLQSNKQAAAQVIEVIKMIQPAQQRIIQHPRPFNPNPRGGGRGRALGHRISPRPPPVRLQPNGLPVPLGRSKPRRRGKRGGKGQVQEHVAPANEAGPSNQANEDVPMGEVEQGIANTTQPDLGTEQEEEPYYEGHDPLTFGTSPF
ncbi:hypothetical protein NLI96_g12462 [Meripilus lineatus]|uniref:RNA-directed DNA polymerase n=1 Tax=Meripilus lineatus TaxID=2056292 RepID=A0AAD5UPY9_9APHY|nr:hypothetical protein NLI96_g12462 [Physisporinus lineatus]